MNRVNKKATGKGGENQRGDPEHAEACTWRGVPLARARVGDAGTCAGWHPERR
jgi:hypothetical protein